MSCLYHLFNTFFARTIRVVKYKIEITRLNRQDHMSRGCWKKQQSNFLSQPLVHRLGSSIIIFRFRADISIMLM